MAWRQQRRPRPRLRRPAATTATAPAASAPETGDHVVVHVRGDRIGELDVYRGTSHTQVQDPDLAARLRRMIR